jgi:hypothetical protein
MRTKRIATVLVRERTRQLVWHVIGAERPNRRAQVAAALTSLGAEIGCAGLPAGNLVPTHPSVSAAPEAGPRSAVRPPTIDLTDDELGRCQRGDPAGHRNGQISSRTAPGSAARTAGEA